MKPENLPERIFIDREDLEWLKKVPRTGQQVMAEFSIDSIFITGTECYVPESRAKELQRQVESLQAQIGVLKAEIIGGKT